MQKLYVPQSIIYIDFCTPALDESNESQRATIYRVARLPYAGIKSRNERIVV